MRTSIKIILVILILAVIGGIAWAGLFYYKNFRGAGPAFKEPKQDIAKLIEEANQKASTTPPVNLTGLPLKLPPGFSIDIYAKNLDGPRVMIHDNAGGLLVSLTKAGKVVDLRDENADGKAEKATTILSGLTNPHGLALRCEGNAAVQTCKLYVAETGQVAVYDYDQVAPAATNKKKIIDLPAGGRHVTRTIMFLPSPDDNKFLISIGSSCDVCRESDPRRGAVYVANADGSDFKPYATGLRNSVFMAIQPVDGRVWATEMGRDYLGDNLPPDEVNIIETATSGPKNYGWPVCYGENIHDTAFDKNTYVRNPCQTPFETPSHIDLPAHSAPLGLAFIPEEGWPQDWWYNLLVAYHGSWNSTTPTGYKIVRVKLDARGKFLGIEDFITGWLNKDNEVLGRPVDILVQPGGTIFVSDDKAGIIYRLAFYEAYKNIKEKAGLIVVKNPLPYQKVSSPLVVTGQARGIWYFEASFPVKLYDGNGDLLAAVPAQAQGDWMTTEFVPFSAKLDFTRPTTSVGTLVLEKDNPSGLPQNADELRLPVNFE